MRHLIKPIQRTLSVINVITTGIKVYRTAKRGFRTYNQFQERVNPIVRFQRKLPPGFRKPYRIGLAIGDAILSGGLIYEAMKFANDGQQSPSSQTRKLPETRNNLEQSRSKRKYSAEYRTSRRSYTRRCKPVNRSY